MINFAQSPETPYCHEKFPSNILVIIEYAIFEALSYISKKRVKKGGMEEIDYNIALQERLNTMLQSKDFSYFTYDMFQDIARDASVCSYDYGHLEKKPDLTFKLSGGQRSLVKDRTNDGLFVECKIIDGKGKKTISGYCKTGISRYVKGEYAWAMPNALMIAYNKTGSSIFMKLEKFLENDEALKFKHSKVAKNENSYTSTHARTWQYPDGSEPGNIEIRHLCFSF
ncbi:MAG: hypothetical protein JKX76_15380 [Colwellia sp.]|nr:hypothetical protein [Colwellia sp.]